MTKASFRKQHCYTQYRANDHCYLKRLTQCKSKMGHCANVQKADHPPATIIYSVAGKGNHSIAWLSVIMLSLTDTLKTPRRTETTCFCQISARNRKHTAGHLRRQPQTSDRLLVLSCLLLYTGLHLTPVDVLIC